MINRAERSAHYTETVKRNFMTREKWEHEVYECLASKFDLLLFIWKVIGKRERTRKSVVLDDIMRYSSHCLKTNVREKKCYYSK